MATKKANQKSNVEEVTPFEECKCIKCAHSKENFITELSKIMDKYNEYISDDDLAQSLVDVAIRHDIDYALLPYVVEVLQDDLVEAIGENLQVIPIITELLAYVEES